MRRKQADEPQTVTEADEALFQPTEPVEPTGAPTPPATAAGDAASQTTTATPSRRVRTGRLRRARRDRRTFAMLVGAIVVIVVGFGVGVWVVSNRSAARLAEGRRPDTVAADAKQPADPPPPAIAPLAADVPRVLGAPVPPGQWQPADVPYDAADYDNATIILGMPEQRGPRMKLPVACGAGRVYDTAILQLVFIDDDQRVYGRYVAHLPLVGAEQTRTIVANVGVEALAELSRMDWSVNFGRTLEDAVALPRIECEPRTIDGGPGVQVSVHNDRTARFSRLQCRLVGYDESGWPVGEWRAELAHASSDANVVRFGVVVDPAEGATPARWQATVVGLP